ncbi:MAG: T9SS type A sorting domain-containing protein [Bacteroidales bacterium]
MKFLLIRAQQYCGLSNIKSKLSGLMFCILTTIVLVFGNSSFTYAQTYLWSCDMSNSTIGAGNAIFPGTTTGHVTSSGFSRSSGTDYACSSGNYVAYSSSSSSGNTYLMTKEFVVPQGNSIKVTLTSRRENSSAGVIKIFYNISGSCSFSTSNNYNNGWIEWATITPNTSIAVSSGCTTQSTPILTNEICGGQIVSVCFFCPNAYSSNWIAIDDIIISAEATVTAVPNITSTTTYTETFNTSDYWYAPVAQTYPRSRPTSSIMMPYHSLKTSSTTYASLWSGGAGSTLWHTGSTGYYCQLPNGSEYCDNTGGTQIFTKEVNTSGCPNAMLRFDFRAWYPSSGNYGYTFDEVYKTYCPKVYYSTGLPTGSIGSYSYNWVEIPMNYYFPTGKWMRVAYALPSANNVKVKIEGKTFTYNNYIDNIQIACEDCRISTQTGADPVGETEPEPNTEYTYTVASTPYATYYRWIIRKLELGGVNPEATLYWDPYNPSTPSIPGVVSGQGTQTAVINFGSCTDCEWRVMCLPYDGIPGAISTPNELCYASIGLLDVEIVMPVSLLKIKAECSNKIVTLSWSTATETNNDYFTIEKSINAEDWVPVGIVDGAGNSNELINYEFEDAEPMSGTSYYRLKQTDFDGKFEYFGPVTVNCNDDATGIIAYPNPAQNNVLIIGSQDVAAEIYLCDLTGRIITSYSCSRLSEPFSIDLQNILPGIYLIRVDSQNSSEYFRVVKE